MANAIAVLFIAFLAAVASAAFLAALSYLYCYGYTGHAPVLLWPILVGSAIYAAMQGFRAAVWAAKELK